MKQQSHSRRAFIKTGSTAAAGWLILPSWIKGFGTPYVQGYPVHNIPADKRLDPQWIKSLYERAKPTTYLKSKNELKYIGMPAGGLHSGTLYLGGDGRLWLWEIYNDDREGIDPKTVVWNDGTTDRTIHNRDGANYVSPAIADNKRTLAQGFAIKIIYNGSTTIKELREEDWDEVSFEATYPLATVTYSSKDLPVKVVLTGGAFFIPLSLEDSELPATSFHIHIENISSQDVEVSVAGWLENGADKISAKAGDGNRSNSVIQASDYTGINYTFDAANNITNQQQDAGTMCFALMEKSGTINTSANPFPVKEDFFTKENNAATKKDAGEKSIAGITSNPSVLKPGKYIETNFVISWHFNHTLKKLQAKMPESKEGYHYAMLYKDAAAVIDYVGKNFKRLSTQTRLWQHTYYDSTLPHWLLERAIINIGTIATANTYRFASGRFWGWEGVNACAGTCTHVWQYGHTLARMFPLLERDTRERVDLGVAMQPDGGIIFRAEFETRPAIDGQAGTILRFYREHQMSADGSFLKNNWDKIKKTVRFMLAQDKNGDGMTDTPMENTLDAVWEGEIAWIVGLCIAAAKAAQLMAEEMNDTGFAKLCRTYVEKGCKNMAEQLFNGEYFIHKPDEKAGRKKLGSYNTCHIDQVYGQSWAFQVGLGRLWDKEKTLSALRALWKYNFAPDVGPYIQTHPGGRPYALEGEAGLIMNTNPHNEPKPYGDNVSWQLGYFHECMSGFEHQVAAHMMAEGMTDEALIITKAIHDRYHAAKRNPYNEIECSDHYARAMASYGTFIAACGFEYHGPKGHIGFAPKLSPENFKVPFTTAEGWGSYEQHYNVNGIKALYTVHFGKLDLETISICLKENQSPKSVVVHLNKEKISCSFSQGKNCLTISLKNRTTLKQGNSLEIKVS